MARRLIDRFLRRAVELVGARGGVIAHIDATIICERPKIGPIATPSAKKSPKSPALPWIASRSRPRRPSGLASPVARKAWRPWRSRLSVCRDFGDRTMLDEDLRARAQAVLTQCRTRGLKIATAESCTGGMVAAALTEIAGPPTSSNAASSPIPTKPNRTCWTFPPT